MPYGPFGNLFPYSDQHALNLDWIIQVAKDFLDQYTHIQEIISNGEESLDQHTTDGLAALAAEKDRLEGLLNVWYISHSEDIADQLTAAVASFGTQAAEIATNVIATIPVDYTTLENLVDTLDNSMKDQRQIYNYLPQVNYFSQAQRGNPATINGRIFTIQPNGEILVTGSGTANATYYVSGTAEQEGWAGFTLPAGTYRFFTKENISSYATVGVRYAGETSYAFYFTNASNTIVTFDEDTPITIGIGIASSVTLPENGLLIQIMIADVNKDVGYIAPWASLANYVPQLLNSVNTINEALNELTLFALSNKTEIEYVNSETLVDSDFHVSFISGGLSEEHSITTNNKRIRLYGSDMPQMKTGDAVLIKNPYEGRIYASSAPGYGSNVQGIITGEDWVTGVVQIPAEYNDSYIGVLIRKKNHINDDISGEVDTMTNYVILRSVVTKEEYKQSHILAGLKLSIMGDSISAMKNYIPEGYDYYYSGSNHGVTSVNQMWWKILCDQTGMVPLIINAWSGSGVTQLEDNAHLDKVPMSDDDRCNALGDGTSDPNIILIAGGINDYTYAESAQSEALPWDGKTTPVISNSFTEAYACMIKKLQTNYPNAIIVALSTWFSMRGTDNGYTLTHAVGSNVYTQTDYNNAIKNVAEQMHIPYMDVSDIGFNRNNFYPTYASDSSTIPTHPNAAGQKVMGMAIAKRLIPLVKAFTN